MEKWVVDEERCKGCGLCLNFCPRNLLELADHFNSQGFKPAGIKNTEQCTSCAMCARMCPETAIEIYRPAKAQAG